jgi:hypothetical protein
MHKKNILKTDASTKQLYGVTMTVNSDGSVTLNGTNSDRYTSLVLSSDDAYDNVKHIPNGSYILCSNSIPGAAVAVTGYKYVNGDCIECSLAYCDSTSPVSFTVDDSYDYNYAEIFIDPEQSYSNKLVKPMIRLAGIANNDWEAYTPSLQEQIDLLFNAPLTEQAKNLLEACRQDAFFQEQSSALAEAYMHQDLDKLMASFLDAVNDGQIGLGYLRAAAGNLLSIPGLGTRGKATAGEINWRIDEILQEYIQQ